MIFLILIVMLFVPYIWIQMLHHRSLLLLVVRRLGGATQAAENVAVSPGAHPGGALGPLSPASLAADVVQARLREGVPL